MYLSVTGFSYLYFYPFAFYLFQFHIRILTFLRPFSFYDTGILAQAVLHMLLLSALQRRETEEDLAEYIQHESKDVKEANPRE